MALPQRTPELFTWNDYLALPDDGKRYEVLDGELIGMASPLAPHQRVLGQLYRSLLEAIEDPRLGTVMLAPFDVKLSHFDVVQPDIVVTLPEHRVRLGAKYHGGPPDLAVEVLSPSTARRDRGRKKDRYRLFGIREYWIVDPMAESVEQYVLEEGSYRFAGEHTDTITLVVAPVRIDLARAFERAR